LFNPDPLKPAPRHWLDDTWLNSSSPTLKTFGEFDWNNVPKLDFSRVKFRQLATPEKAKVLDDDADFVLETFGRKPPYQPNPTQPRAGEPHSDTIELSEVELTAEQEAALAADDLELQRQEQALLEEQRLQRLAQQQAEREQQREL